MWWWRTFGSYDNRKHLISFFLFFFISNSNLSSIKNIHSPFSCRSSYLLRFIYFILWKRRLIKLFFSKLPNTLKMIGDYMGMGDYMGKVEIDERGRLTLPSKIREKLLIQPGDKLTIKVNPDNSINIKKSPTKKEIFEKLVGCITTPSEEKLTPEMIKSIWTKNQ